VIPPKTPPPPIRDALGESNPEGDRVTLVPSFDHEAFARESESETDRQTVVPEFDPEAFARDTELRQHTPLPSTRETTIDEARRILEEGDPERALFLLAHLLELAPFHSEANTLSTACRATLERECLSAIGSESVILVVVASPVELKGRGLDSVSGFLLSLMDGATDVETLLDLCGLPRLLALRHLRGLLAHGIVEAAQKPI
jgi:hypothetical protein